MARTQPRFAKPDRLKVLVQSVLSDNLVKAYWFLKGGKESGLRTMQLTHEGGSHRWLETDDGEIIDLTIGTGEERLMRHFRYEDGRDRPFIKGNGEISVRAQEIVDRVERARGRRLT